MSIISQFRAQHKEIISTQGRIGRFTYFAWTFIGMMLSGFLLSILFKVISYGSSSITSLWSAILLVIAPVIILFQSFWVIITIKRLHDLNLNGWLWLLVFVPLANVWLFINLNLLKGNSDENNYGSPRATTPFENIMAWISIAAYASLLLLPIIFGKSL